MRFLELYGPCEQIKRETVNKIIMKAVDISYKSILSHFEVSFTKLHTLNLYIVKRQVLFNTHFIV